MQSLHHLLPPKSSFRWGLRLILGVAFALVNSRPAAADNERHETEIDAYVNVQLKAQHIPGISVAVLRNGQSIHAKGYGFANAELSVPATENTAYEILSATKQFTAAGIMLLVEQQKLSLDQSVADFLSDLPKTWNSITIRHLLTHTSGIPDYTHVPGWKDTIRLDRSPAELLKPVFALPLEFDPGTKWKYSNSGYIALGLIIEKVSGETYVDFLAKRIFQPLGMTATRLGSTRDLIPNRATGYVWNGRLLNDEYVSPSQKWAAGGVVSTVSDLAKWAQSLEKGTLLKSASLQTMLTPARLANGANGDNAPYGFGNELDQDHGRPMAGHQGNGVGFNATFLHYPADHLEVIVLANLRNANSLQLARHIAGIVLPELSDANKPGIPDDPKITQMLEGVLKEAARGKVDPAVFNAGVQAKLVPFLTQTGPRFLGRLGELRSLTLIESNLEPTNRTLRYRAKFDATTIIWTFKLDEANRILALEPRPE